MKLGRRVIASFRNSPPGTALVALRRRWAARRAAGDLVLIRDGPQPRRSDIVCIAAVRNEILRLPDFFRHYRRLGVDRFIFIDNGSTDGSREFLLDQPGVELHATNAAFGRAHGSATWRQALLRRRASGCWGLSVDVDEHLVYDGCERHGLADLAGRLERAGRASLPAMMLDMYPDGPLDEAVPAPDRSLVEICPLFDGEGYMSPADRPLYVGPRIRWFIGGPRRRLFAGNGQSAGGEAGKTPFARWDLDTTLLSPHALHPSRLNLGTPTGVLLHFKLMADLLGRTETAVREGQYFGNSIAYRRMLPSLREAPRLSAVWEGSRRYESSRSLVQAGYMTPIDW
ncbi:MAG: glycosyltransferase family 2 protein [Sphingomonadales bacterium]